MFSTDVGLLLTISVESTDVGPVGRGGQLHVEIVNNRYCFPVELPGKC